MCDGECKWIVLVLRDRYANDCERECLKRGIMLNFSLCDDDVYYVPFGDSPVHGNYLFVREHDKENSLRDILEYKRDAFEAYPMHMRITDGEFRSMLDGIESTRHVVEAKHGDIVQVKNGKYRKLYGIVLREDRSGRIDIGLKFHFGTIVEQMDSSDFEVVGNIFRHLKILR